MWTVLRLLRMIYLNVNCWIFGQWLFWDCLYGFYSGWWWRHLVIWQENLLENQNVLPRVTVRLWALAWFEDINRSMSNWSEFGYCVYCPQFVKSSMILWSEWQPTPHPLISCLRTSGLPAWSQAYTVNRLTHPLLWRSSTTPWISLMIKGLC